jgi:hypothetical protein
VRLNICFHRLEWMWTGFRAPAMTKGGVLGEWFKPVPGVHQAYPPRRLEAIYIKQAARIAWYPDIMAWSM